MSDDDDYDAVANSRGSWRVAIDALRDEARDRARDDPGSARRIVGAREAGSVRGEDFYASPPSAVWALLAAEVFEGPIWEPACGGGAISEVLKAAGHGVISTDLVDRGYGAGRVDFLMETRPMAPNIVTNPPYKNGVAFARRALDLTTGKVAFLMRLLWLEGAARRSLFENSPLARVHVFSKRIPRMHREGHVRSSSGSSIAFAWFVWEHGHVGAPEIRWIEPMDGPGGGV